MRFPHAIFPFDNDWGIPLLDHHFCPNFFVPLDPWRSKSSQISQKQGGWHFYIDDSKIEPLWNKPDNLLPSQPLMTVEPNFSLPIHCPKAIALFQIYRKRFLARYWQSKGIYILVDMNVDEQYLDLNLLGVPQGWSAYSSCGFKASAELLTKQWEQAKCHAKRDDILFIVYGGGLQVQTLASNHHWVYLPPYHETRKMK